MKRLSPLVILCLLLATAAQAEEARIVLWNGRELFDVSHVQNRSDELFRFAQEVEPDVLLLDEVCSLAAAEKVKEVMGLSDYHIACSDFNQRDDIDVGETYDSPNFPGTGPIDN